MVRLFSKTSPVHDESTEPNSGEERQMKNAKSDARLLPPPIDAELVRETRERLRQMYEEGEPEEKAKYSKIHYEHIMDEKYPQTCWRYLVFNQMNIEDSLAQMIQNLIFREESQTDKLSYADYVKDFWLRTPLGFVGRANDGTDLLYAIGRNYRKADGAEAQAIVRKFVMLVAFDWDRLHQHDMAKLTMVFDLSQTTLRNVDLDFTAWLVSLRDYMPARVQAIYLVGVPFILRPVVRLIISWLSERYRRICFCTTLEHLLEGAEPVLALDQIPVEAGGEAPDTWRLAPPEAPWAQEAKSGYSNEELDRVYAAISFNCTDERLDNLYEMQQKFDSKQAKSS